MARWGEGEGPPLALLPPSSLEHSTPQRQPEQPLLSVAPTHRPSLTTANGVKPTYPSNLISDSSQHNHVCEHKSIFTVSSSLHTFQPPGPSPCSLSHLKRLPGLLLFWDCSSLALWDLSSLPIAHTPLIRHVLLCLTKDIHGCRAQRRGGLSALGAGVAQALAEQSHSGRAIG